MAIKITKDGIKTVKGFHGYIGMEANAAIQQLMEERSYKRVCDSIGYNSLRCITMVGLEKRIEIICETDDRENILNGEMAPSEADWKAIDIFEYYDRPIKGKGFF